MNLVPLGEVARISRESVKPNEIPTGTIYVGLEHISEDGSFVSVGTVSSGDLASNKFRFDERHILYGKLRPYLRKIALPLFSGICSTDILPILPGARVDRSYLYHFLRTPAMVGLATSRSTGANLPRLSPTQLARFEIPLPPLPEQRRIAAVLDAADGLRAKRRAALGKLDALLQSVFLEMFGDPVGNERGWETATLESLVKNQKYALRRGPFGGALKKEIFVPSGYKVYEQQHAIDKDFDSGSYYINEAKFREMESFSVSPGDFIVSCSGTVGRIARLPDFAVPGVINQALLKIRIDESRINPIYFEHLFGHPSTQRALFEATRGSGIKNFPPMEIVRAFPLPVPPQAVQQEFERMTEKMQAISKVFQSSLVGIRELFQSIQQRAFRGGGKDKR